MNAIRADNRQYINSIPNSKSIKLTAFDNYQINIRIVPHMIYGVDSKETTTFKPSWYVIHHTIYTVSI